MGARWDDSKVGRRSVPGTEYADLRDPANGAKVPRCAVCGMPTETFLLGRWSGDGRTYRVRVCSHCVGADVQPNPDPLSVEAA